MSKQILEIGNNFIHDCKKISYVLYFLKIITIWTGLTLTMRTNLFINLSIIIIIIITYII